VHWGWGSAAEAPCFSGAVVCNGMAGGCGAGQEQQLPWAGLVTSSRHHDIILRFSLLLLVAVVMLVHPDTAEA